MPATRRALSIATRPSFQFIPASARNDPGIPTTFGLEKKRFGFVASVINNQVQSVSQTFTLTNDVRLWVETDRDKEFALLSP